jgi:type II secretory pathway pseudopilin PulG
MGKIKNNQGFTLVEVIVVAGIMTLFSVTLVSVFLATIRGGNKSQLTQAVHQEGDFALKRMASLIRGAAEVDCDGEAIMVTPLFGPPVTFSLVMDQGIPRVASDSSQFLTGTTAAVSNLNFVCFDSLLGNQVVILSLTLKALPLSGGSGQVQEQSEQFFATSVSTRQH